MIIIIIIIELYIAGWKDVSISEDSGLIFVQMQNDSSGHSVAMSLTIHEDFTWLLHIKGKLVTAIVESAPVYLNIYSNVKSLVLYLSKSKNMLEKAMKSLWLLKRKGNS